MTAARVVPVDPAHPDPAVLDEAAAILRAGHLVAFPTETVYGLGAIATDPAAVARIFAAKGRPADNPLIVHVADLAMARACAASWPEAADRVAGAFWPGPVSLLVPRGPAIPPEVTAGLPVVGLRLPANPVARALIARVGKPLAAPSANPYTGISPTLARHVIAGLGDRVELVLDAGPASVGIESTVLDLTVDPPVVRRPGGVSVAQLEAVVPGVHLAIEVLGDEGPRVSPGLARRHYAPRTPLRLVAREALSAEVRAASGPLGAVTVGPPPADLAVRALRALPADPAGYAAELYGALHELDRAGIAEILVEAVPEGADWLAVRDRLARAAEGP